MTNLPTATRNTDPHTSALAEAEVTASGHRLSNMERCLEAVKRSPGLTAEQVGEVTGLGHWRATKRLSDLKNKGLVYQGEASRVTGRAQVTWYPKAEREEALSALGSGDAGKHGGTLGDPAPSPRGSE